MDITRIVAELDAQIAKLHQARALFAGVETSASAVATVKGKRGRPKGTKNRAATEVVTAAEKTAPATKRNLSTAGRKAISEAMKKRWAQRRKA